MDLVAKANELIPLPKSVSEDMYQDGNTDDIVSVILHADKYAAKDTEKFATLFTPDYEGLKKLWHFVKSNIQYVEDKPGHERIKSPAKTWKDRKGDCKSFSILIGSVGQNLRLPFHYRTTAYMGDKNVSHVYPVFYINGREVIMDAVHTKFDEEVSYSKKKDYSGQKLARIGITPKSENYLLPVLTWFVFRTAIKNLQ